MKKYHKIFDKVNKEEQHKMVKNEQSSNNTANPSNAYFHKNDKQIETVILAGMHFQGDVKGSHNLFLNGEFNGTIDLDALLFVGQSGKMMGEVKAERVIIEGSIEGTITANEKIELREGGKCKGDILTPSVMISEKAFFQGQVTMLDNENENSEPNNKMPTEKQKTDSPSITVVDQKDTSVIEEKQRRRKILVNDE